MKKKIKKYLCMDLYAILKHGYGACNHGYDREKLGR